MVLHSPGYYRNCNSYKPWTCTNFGFHSMTCELHNWSIILLNDIKDSNGYDISKCLKRSVGRRFGFEPIQLKIGPFNNQNFHFIHILS